MASFQNAYSDKSKEGLVPFSLSIPEYDQTTYRGRLFSLLKTQNLFNTFLTTRMVQKAQKLIEEQRTYEKDLKEGGVVYMTPSKAKELYNAQYRVASSVHPDTNEILPFYKRF